MKDKIPKIPGGVEGCTCHELKAGSRPTGAYNLNPDCPIHASKKVRLWHDDVRPAPAGWVHARTNKEAIDIFINNEVVEASLDHDMGYEGKLPEKCTCDNGKVRYRVMAEDKTIISDCPNCDGDGFIGGDLMYVAGTSEEDGTKLAEWLAANTNYMPLYITIHSWNPNGAARMNKILREAGADVVVEPYLPAKDAIF